MKKLLVCLIIATLCVFALLPPSTKGQSTRQRSKGQNQSGSAKFRRVEGAIPGQYIVSFKLDIGRSDIAPLANELARIHGGRIMFIYEDALKGFAIELPEMAAIALSKNPQVEYVEENGFATLSGVQSTPDNVSTFWGIDRIDQRPRTLSQTYNYNRVGSGVHAYILDTGIWITHQDFGTRAHAVDAFTGGYDSYGGNAIDTSPHSHGTKVAGVVGGKRFGVAKNVQLHAVKVCDYSPFYGYEICPNANIIAGLNWVAGNHYKPAVVNMSFGGPANTAVDNAVRNTSATGVTCVAGAGNANTDAGGTSPARVWEAITVGATTEADNKASYSNYGWSLDLWAPGSEYTIGEYIPVPFNGASNGRNDNTDGFSGTSAAAPHVTGVAALYLETYSLYTPNDPATLPGNVSNAITGNATPDAISGIPQYCYTDYETWEYICEFTSPNLLLYSSFVAPPTSNPIDDQRFYVRQQYYDTLRRQPEQGGWDAWTNYINQCGGDPTCLNQRRITTARGFLESSEFRNSHPILRDNPIGSDPYDREYVRQLYICYLQRFPDEGEDVSNNPWFLYIRNHPGDYDPLVGGFINSTEYRELRFK